tara:strand:- start:148583 stop:149035 length:453 start_codon:yes stop_codon:yes gene_type:complete
MNVFDTTRVIRTNILGLVENLTEKQLNTIPEGYNNNIVWHLGHVLATQQLLSYGLSGIEILLSDNIIEEFRKGTAPKTPYSDEDIEELKSLFIEVIDRTEQDFNDEVFEQFNSYPTSFGVTLNSIEEAVSFNNVHEALHMGIIMAMRKLV